MVGMRKYIITKALRCIDEVYPDDNDANGPHFPLEEFIDEAGRRVLLAAPLHVIPNRAALTECVLRPHTDGSGEIDLPDDFLKLARLRMEGWQRPVLAAIPEEHPAARRQYHPVTRGGTAKPVVLLTHGGTRLRYFSVTEAQHRIAEGEYIAYTSLDDTYPERLAETTAMDARSIGIRRGQRCKRSENGRGTRNGNTLCIMKFDVKIDCMALFNECMDQTLIDYRNRTTETGQSIAATHTLDRSAARYVLRQSSQRVQGPPYSPPKTGLRGAVHPRPVAISDVPRPRHTTGEYRS